jgi:hypothetical protein
MVGLCLVAVFAIAAIAASSASALPEFGECVVQPKHEGKFTESNCIKKANKVAEKFTGEFEWRKASEVEGKEIGGASVAAVLQTTFTVCQPSDEKNLKECRAGEETEHFGPIAVECSKEQNFGQITGPNTLGHVVARFTHCAVFGSTPCGNSSEEGTIFTNNLKGKLGWINKGTKPRQVGVVLEPETKKGEFAKFTCAGLLIVHVGEATEAEFPAYPPKGGGDGIISPITPVNEMTRSFTQVYSFNAAEENIPNKFEGTAPLKVLEDWEESAFEPTKQSKWSKAGEALTNTEHPCALNFPVRSCASEESELDVKAGEIKAN